MLDLDSSPAEILIEMGTSLQPLLSCPLHTLVASPGGYGSQCTAGKTLWEDFIGRELFHKCRFGTHFSKILFFLVILPPHTWSLNLKHIHSISPQCCLWFKEFHYFPIVSAHVAPSKIMNQREIKYQALMISPGKRFQTRSGRRGNMGERISAKRQKGMEIRVDAQSQLKEASHSCFQAEIPSFLLFFETRPSLFFLSNPK